MHNRTLALSTRLLILLSACGPEEPTGSATVNLTLSGEIEPDAGLDMSWEASQGGEIVASGALEAITSSLTVPAGELELTVSGSWSLDSASDTGGSGASGCVGSTELELADGETLDVELQLSCSESWSD